MRLQVETVRSGKKCNGKQLKLDWKHSRKFVGTVSDFTSQPVTVESLHGEKYKSGDHL